MVSFLKSGFAVLFVGITVHVQAQSVPNPVSLFRSGAVSARSAGLTVNDSAVYQLRQTTGTVKLAGVPLVSGLQGNFTLSPASVFGPDAAITIMKANGTSETRPLPDIKTWIGSDPSNPGRAMFVSADSAGKLNMMITGDAQTSVTVISPDSQGTGSEYVVEAADIPEIPYCNTEELLQPAGDPEVLSAPATSRAVGSDVLYEVEMMVDVGTALYQKLGSDDTRVASYLADLFGAVNSIYQRDLKARLSIVSLTVWDTTDPFNQNHPDDISTGLRSHDQLYNYRDYIVANRSSINFDLAHLIDNRTTFGGVAYVGVMQSGFVNNRGYRTGVSNVYANADFPDLNTYFWDTKVVAHEIGHNVGSKHTHCYPIPPDCCHVESNCTGCTTAAPAEGTIMSYCHLQISRGGSLLMKFHEASVDIMRPLIESSPLVAAFTEQPDIMVKGMNDNMAINDATEPDIGTSLKAQTIGGAAVTQQFTIHNDGTQPLTLNGSPLVGIDGNPLLSISAQPGTTVLAPGTTTSFEVRFDPHTVGLHTATVQIASNDPDTPSYTFVVGGRIVQPSEPFTTTFTGSQAVAEGSVWTIVPLQVSGVPGNVTDVDFRINGTNCGIPEQTGIQHADVRDLHMELRSPAGTRVRLMLYPGIHLTEGGENFCNTLLDDGATNQISLIEPAGAPYSATYKPDVALSTFNGELPNGTWQFRVADAFTPDIGTVRSVSVIIRGEVTASTEDWELY